MIAASFHRAADSRLCGFSVSGHSGTAEAGQDIVCASVSSAVMYAINTLTDVFELDALAEVYENEIRLSLREDPDSAGSKIILGLMMHLQLLCEEFPQAIKVRECKAKKPKPAKHD